ncbi:MAG: di-trans,poly-cis-decaprenylcistransferase [Erysipelotrichaceae bacterium]|jgi:undecaprenyl diphosphate synthase|nr:di-trans,poly-cis-decaprenylcistransferase [Erysipelotrichaceae bacterium]
MDVKTKPISHVALIMDGNGRWAKARGLPRHKGHEEGCKRIIEIFDAVKANHIKVMTLYAFSTENWNRPKMEIKQLFGYLDKFFKDNIATFMKDGIRVQIMGDISRLPEHTQKVVIDALEKTKDNDNYVFNIALNYGSQQEIVKATKEIALMVKENKINIEDITIDTISNHLYTANLPPIDLMIRTSGEQRLSNYLLFQLAYSEFIFTPTYWPDFTKEKFERCLQEFYKRNRRFGKIEEE